MRRSQWTVIILACLLAVVDQLSKWLAHAALHPVHPLPLWPGVFQLTLAYNTGAAFSLMHGQPAFLTALTGAILLILLGYLFSRKTFLKGEATALALILGGALGNFWDRLLYGKVTDFFDFILIRYPVFNVADSFIFCGVCLLIVTHLRHDTGSSKTAEAMQE